MNQHLTSDEPINGVNELKRWLSDLELIIAEQNLSDDPDIQYRLSKLAIEVSGLEVQFPDQTSSLRRAIFSLHQHSVVDQILEVLQSVLGYYHLPDQPKGRNEPIIGSEIAHTLKHQISARQLDLYEIKNQLALLLNEDNDLETPN